MLLFVPFFAINFFLSFLFLLLYRPTRHQSSFHHPPPHRYLFRSGNHEHPSDKFYNTTVEVLPDQLSEESVIWQQYNTTTDGYLIIGSFNAFGMAEGSVDVRIGKLRELRLHVHTESENWVILSEVS